MSEAIEARSVRYMGREAVLLSHERSRAVIDRLGGMMPEFSVRRGAGFVNAHWIPDFRGDMERPWSEGDHGPYWKAKLLYILAGDFPCVPNYGGNCVVDGVAMPIHGFSANEVWTLDRLGASRDEGAAWARFTLESPDPSYRLSLCKSDIMFDGQPAYFSLMRLRNTGDRPLSVTMGRHNTLGSPFLQTGSKISLAAERFAVPPGDAGAEPLGRLAAGAEFESLDAAPLRAGGTADIGVVPGMIGATDLVTGAIPSRLALGWSCVANPALGLAYVSFFPGEAGLPDGEIALGFNVLWMQYGGRPFTPWALHEGGADRTFCLGAENTVGAFANGLAWALGHPKLLGRDCLVTVPAGGERRLCYGTALVELSPEILREGVRGVEAEEGALVLKGGRSSQRVPMDATFTRSRRLEGRI